MTAVNDQDREMAAGSGGMPGSSFDYGPRGNHGTPEGTSSPDQGSSAAPPDANTAPPPPSSADQTPPPASGETPPSADAGGGGDSTPVAAGGGSEPPATAGAGTPDTGDTSGAEASLQPVLGTVDDTISGLAGGTGALDGGTDGLNSIAPVSGVIGGTSGIVNPIIDATGLDTGGLITPVTGAVDGLVNDLTNLPGTLLSGGLVNDVTGLLDSALGTESPLGSGSVLSPVTTLVGDVGNSLGLPLLDTAGGEGGNGLLGTGLGSEVTGLVDSTLGGSGSVLSPVTTLVGDAGNGLGVPLLDTSGGDNGNGLLGTGLGNGVTGLVDTALGNDPGADTVLGPVTSPASNVSHGLQHVPLLSVDNGDTGSVTLGGDNGSNPVDSATGLVGSALGTDNVLSPVTNLVGTVGSDVPLAHLNGGDAGSATVGDLNGSPSGNLVDLAAGQSADGLGLGVLSPAASDNHLLEVNGVDVGPAGPHLVDADLAPGLNGDAAAPVLNSLGPVTNLVGDLDSSVPLATLNGGDLGSATVGDLHGSQSGDLVDLAAGQSADGLGLGLLSPAASDNHLLDVNGVDVGPAGPQLVDADLVPGLNGDALGSLLNGVSPATSLVGDLDSSVPLATLNGGDVGNATVGDLHGSSSGDLVDLAAGQSADGLGLGLLSPADSDNHLLDVNGVDVGANGPQLVDADLVPALNGDALSGDAAAPLVNGLDLSGLGNSSGPLAAVSGAGSDIGIGDLNGSSSGHLLDASAGPHDADGTGIDVLATPLTDGHTLDIGAVDVGSDGPQLADASLLNDSGLFHDAGLPSLDGLGLPSLGSASDLLDTGSSLATVNGGNNAADGGLIGGTIGTLDSSSTGHLVDADVGSSPNGGSVDVLAAPTSTDHALSVNAVDVGAHGPQLADLGVLTDQGAINLPALGGTGADSLVGNVLGDVGGISAPAEAAPAPTTDTADLHGLLPAITGDHGIVDVAGHHVI